MDELWKFVLEVSYQASIVGIILLLVKTILKSKLSPRWNYFLGLILIVKLMIPFGPESSISIFNKIPQKTSQQVIINSESIHNKSNSNNINEYEDVNQNNNIFNYGDKSNQTLENVTQGIYEQENNVNTLGSKVDKLFRYMPYIWAIMAFNIMIFIILIYTHLNIRLRKNNLEVNDKMQNILDRAKSKINVSSKVKVLINQYVSTPALSGILRPKILLPVSMIDLSEKELEYIFLHELSHYKRKDILVNYIILVLQAIHWFNPIIWYLLKKVREDIEFATDEKVLRILEDKEHREYAMSIISVLEKVNKSLFNPTIVTMANDKKKVEKRIRGIKNMKVIKNKQLMFTVVGILAVIIIAPIVLTNANKDSKKSGNQEILSKATNEIELNETQRLYREVVEAAQNGGNIGNENLKNLLPDKKMREQDGYIYSPFIENNFEDIRSFELKEGKEKVSITYPYINNIQQEATNVHYLDQSKNGYVNGVHAMYNINGTDENKFITDVGSASVEDQKKLVDNINIILKGKDVYQTYYKFAELAEKSAEFPKEEYDKIQEDKKIDLGENQIGISMDNCMLALIYDDNQKYLKAVKLVDKNNKILLLTISEYGKGVDIMGEVRNVSMTEITSETLNDQEYLLLKLLHNAQEYTPTDVKNLGK